MKTSLVPAVLGSGPPRPPAVCFAMEATPAKAVNDLFMVFSLECAGSSLRCSVVMHEYAGQERSAK